MTIPTRYQMVVAGRTINSDTLVDLVDAFIPGYNDLESALTEAGMGDLLAQKSLEARRDCAEQFVMIRRDMLLAHHGEEIDGNAMMLRPDLAEAIAASATDLSDSDRVDYTQGLVEMISTDPGLPTLTGAAWAYPFPVVAVKTAYLNEDGTYQPIPSGNVQLIDPTTDSTLLYSLQELGFCQWGELPPDQSANIDNGTPTGWTNE